MELLFSQITVKKIKLLHAFFFVIEHLYNFLSCNTFFNIAVYRTECRLLTAVILTAHFTESYTAFCKNRQEYNSNN